VSDVVENVRALITPFELLDVAAGVGALQLLPDNGGRIWRLEAAAGVLATCSPNGANHMSNARWSRWINGAELTEVLGVSEDPFPNLFTDAFTLPSGSFVVFPGLEEDAIFVLRHVIAACVRLAESSDGEQFGRLTQPLWMSVLSLSDEVATRASLARGQRIRSSGNTEVIVPAAARFAALKQAVTFERAELDSILRRAGGSVEALSPLIHDVAAPAEWDGQSSANPILFRPLIRHSERYVVFSPHALLGALRTSLIRAALAAGHRPEFVDEFRRATFASVTSALDWMGIHPLQEPSFRERGSEVAESFFHLDTDKVVHVLLATDPLIDYTPESPNDHWDASGLRDLIDSRLRWVDANAPTGAPWVRSILHLVVIQGFGRAVVLGLNHSGTSCLLTHLNGAALDAIALFEGGDPLALWHFTRWSERLRRYARVMVFSALDEYGLYRSKGHSFYLNDDEKPNFVAISPDWGEGLHGEISDKRDFHGVLVPWEGRVREVTLLHSDRAFPVYILWRDSWRHVALLLEGFSIPIWMVARQITPKPEYRQLYLGLADMLCYWLWQMSTSLRAIISAAPPGLTSITIEIEVEESPGWFHHGTSAAADDAVTCKVEKSGQLAVRFGFAAASLLAGPNNEGERSILRSFLPALLDLIRTQDQKGPQIDIDQILDRFAPLGPKKKLMILGQDLNLRLIEGDLEPYRPIQNAAKQIVLDELGEHLARLDWWRPGEPIPRERRTNVLNDAVIPYLFSRLVEVVRSLDPAGVLERLVAFNERLVHEQAQREFQLPTRLACFETEPSLVGKLIEESPRLSAASIASRFLIEYITAQPPAGTAQMSLGHYDDMMALSGEIDHWGLDSDSIHFGLGEIGLDMLKSRRIGVDREQSRAAEHEYFNVFYTAEIGRSSAAFPRYWRTTQDPDPKKPRLVEDADRAAEAEFGISLTDLQVFLQEVINIGFDLPGEAKVLPAEELKGRLRLQTQWNDEKVHRCFERFCARPRQEFLVPPPPFRREDVFPWRFNRALSYLRKPLLVRATPQGDETVWGIRHVDLARNYLVALCVGGRLKAESKEMKAFIGRIHSAQAEAFNDRVADLYDGRAGVIVKRRVKKVGRLRIQRNNGQDLGDIDVLVADSTRHRIYPIETKDLAVARTPAELANELSGTFQTGGPHKSSLGRHLERVEWLQQHLDQVINWLALDPSRKWKIEPMVVTDTELLSPFLQRTAIPVLSFRMLKARLA
jgi:hypothetical protein